MDAGWDPCEGIFPSIGLIVSWLLAVAYKHYISCILSIASREFVAVRGCTIMCSKITVTKRTVTKK